MSYLEISLFGPFRATLDGVPLRDFESNKVRALLAYLGVERTQPHQRIALATLLWPEMTDAAALRNLRHAIFNLRRCLGDPDATTPFLLITRHTLHLNPDANIAVDVTKFHHFLSEASTPGISRDAATAAWQRAISVAQGEFLHGFSVRGSAAWDEWVLLRREEFDHGVSRALQQLTQIYGRCGDYERAQEYAALWVRRAPWNEEAHQWLIRILALAGRRSAALAQYERCRSMLMQSLGVEPTQETISLAEAIRSGSFSSSGSRSSSRTSSSSERKTVPSQHHFVSRQKEMGLLMGFLKKGLAGEPQMVFITGEAGSGKSALAVTFVRKAFAELEDIVALRGEGDAFAGTGDPFLPFRDILLSLAGDADALWLGQDMGAEYFRRIQRLPPIAIPILIRTAPDLVDVLGLASTLVIQAEAFLLQSAHKRDLLQELRQHERRSGKAPLGSSQSQGFAQFTRLLSRLSDYVPLLLVLDDLQWADAGSLSLLFHLGRRLNKGRVMLLGIFRSEEVLGTATVENRPPHPLALIVREMQRFRGDVLIDLDQSMGRDFVDAYLDVERNRLDEDFRQQFFRHTGGNALFTVELLQALRERGDLFMDSGGYWHSRPGLAWERIPPRIEAVIAERTRRLPLRWREILSVASVAGESFSAELLASVLSRPLDEVRRALDTLASFPRRLVQFRGHSWAGRKMLTMYRFRHILFRDYLYNSLSGGERARWHGRIGYALEEMYEKREESSPVLARHFEYAGLPLKSSRYYLMAGRRAMLLFAPAEALALYSRGMALLQKVPDSREKFEQETSLQIAMSAPLMAMQGWGSSEHARATRRAYDLCRRFGDERQLIQAMYLQADTLRARGEYLLSLRIGKHLLNLAQEEKTSSGLALAHWTLGETYFFIGELDRAREHLAQALDHYSFLESAPVPLTATDLGVVCHVWMAWAEQRLGHPDAGERHVQVALELARSLGQPLSLIFALALGAYGFYWLVDDPEAAAAYEDEIAPLMEQEKLSSVRPWGQVFQGWVLAKRGDLREGIQMMKAGMDSWQEVGAVSGRTCQAVPLIRAYIRADMVNEARTLVRETLALLERTGERLFERELTELQREILARR